MSGVSKKIGIELTLPEGKLPGFYAQIVKALAGKAHLFDRDKDMLVVSTEADKTAVEDIMTHYKVGIEIAALWLLPEDTIRRDIFSDYGFTSRSENHYLFTDQVSLFTFPVAQPAGSEKQQALEQMEEHLIASFYTDEQVCYAVPQTLMLLIEGIARAYNCKGIAKLAN
jgi:hypothetical protein